MFQARHAGKKKNKQRKAAEPVAVSSTSGIGPSVEEIKAEGEETKEQEEEQGESTDWDEVITVTPVVISRHAKAVSEPKKKPTRKRKSKKPVTVSQLLKERRATQGTTENPIQVAEVSADGVISEDATAVTAVSQLLKEHRAAATQVAQGSMGGAISENFSGVTTTSHHMLKECRTTLVAAASIGNLMEPTPTAAENSAQEAGGTAVEAMPKKESLLLGECIDVPGGSFISGSESAADSVLRNTSGSPLHSVSVLSTLIDDNGSSAIALAHSSPTPPDQFLTSKELSGDLTPLNSSDDHELEETDPRPSIASPSMLTDAVSSALAAASTVVSSLNSSAICTAEPISLSPTITSTSPTQQLPVTMSCISSSSISPVQELPITMATISSIVSPIQQLAVNLAAVPATTVSPIHQVPITMAAADPLSTAASSSGISPVPTPKLPPASVGASLSALAYDDLSTSSAGESRISGQTPQKKKRRLKKGGRTRADSESDIYAWRAMLSDMAGSPSAESIPRGGSFPPVAARPPSVGNQENPGIKGLEGMTPEQVEENADHIVKMLVGRILEKHTDEMQRVRDKKQDQADKKAYRKASGESKSLIGGDKSPASASHSLNLSIDDNNSNMSSGTAWSLGSLLSPTGSVTGGIIPAAVLGVVAQSLHTTVVPESMVMDSSASCSPAGMIPVTSPPPPPPTLSSMPGVLPGVATFSPVRSVTLSVLPGVSSVVSAAAVSSLPAILHSGTVTTSASNQYLQQKLDSRALLGLPVPESTPSPTAPTTTTLSVEAPRSDQQEQYVAGLPGLQLCLKQTSSSRCITFAPSSTNSDTDVTSTMDTIVNPVIGLDSGGKIEQSISHVAGLDGAVLKRTQTELSKEWMQPSPVNGMVDSKAVMVETFDPRMGLQPLPPTAEQQKQRSLNLRPSAIPGVATVFGGQSDALDLSSKILKSEKLDEELASLAMDVQQAIDHDHDDHVVDPGATAPLVSAVVTMGATSMEVDTSAAPVKQLVDHNMDLVDRLRNNSKEEVPQCTCLGGSEYFLFCSE